MTKKDWFVLLIPPTVVAFAAQYVIEVQDKHIRELKHKNERLLSFSKKLAEKLPPAVLNDVIFESKFEDIVFHEEKRDA